MFVLHTEDYKKISRLWRMRFYASLLPRKDFSQTVQDKVLFLEWFSAQCAKRFSIIEF
jgi:hypothetical protein